MHNFDDMTFLNSALNRGAFIISGDNPMIASWGFIGVMWGKKVFVAPIRESRYTKKFLDETGEFTVSIPKEGEFASEIAFCGSKSGRDFDKWAETGIKKQSAKSVSTVVVDGCDKYFECKVITVVPMGDIDLGENEKWYPKNDKYPKGDRHFFYFGEIIEEY